MVFTPPFLGIVRFLVRFHCHNKGVFIRIEFTAIFASALILVVSGGVIFAESGVATAALHQLMEGNVRFVAGQMSHPHQDPERRKSLADSQRPVAVVVACSDSRVAPEFVFDQGLGDLFVVRSAGNLVDSVGLGSIEYAVEHLGVELIVVMGHEKCGAVTAAVTPGSYSVSIQVLADQIRNHLKSAHLSSNSAVLAAVEANIKVDEAELVTESPMIQEKLASGHLKIVGGTYSLSEGTFLMSED